MSSPRQAWDLTVLRPTGSFPSWFEVTEDSGRYVGIWGSARPISSISINENQIEFSLPPQYEGCNRDLRFELTVDGDTIRGHAWIWDDEPYPVEGRKAPSLQRTTEVVEGDPVDLLANGTEGFEVRWPEMDDNWSMIEGELVNSAKGTDIITMATFTDFRLEAEYSYPAGSNSGIYLRGRYEFQILDDFGAQPSVGSSAAIYGFFAPIVNAVKPADEWNRAVIELIGREVKIELNGQVVVQETIPGITGGALDSNEGEAGPILLQGDHGPVTFRKLVLTPLG